MRAPTLDAMRISPTSTVASLAVAHGEHFIAPGAPVFRSRGRQALDGMRDLGLGVLLVWSLPLAWGVAGALGDVVAGWLTR